MIETIAITERDEGEERGEHEGQHGERADAADQRLEQHAGALVVGAAVLGQRVEAGQVHRRAGDRCARRARRWRPSRPRGFSPNAESGSGCG